MDINGGRLVIRTYVIDDGWKLPYEVIEEIDFRIARSKKDAYDEVVRQNKMHRGKWLTAKVAREFAAKSWVYRVLNGEQYTGMVREYGEELQREYGVTELEAINILFERNVSDYVRNYTRIKNLQPLNINEQTICDEVVSEYMVAM